MMWESDHGSVADTGLTPAPTAGACAIAGTIPTSHAAAAATEARTDAVEMS